MSFYALNFDLYSTLFHPYLSTTMIISFMIFTTYMTFFYYSLIMYTVLTRLCIELFIITITQENANKRSNKKIKRDDNSNRSLCFHLSKLSNVECNTHTYVWKHNHNFYSSRFFVSFNSTEIILTSLCYCQTKYINQTNLTRIN